MSAWLARLLPAVMLFALSAAPAPAAPPTVKDEGKLFSERAVKEANAIIADIDKQYHKEVHVEAHNKVPPAKADEFNRNKTDPAFRARFFRAWASERFTATGTNGVFVLIYKESPRGYYVKVDVGEKT